jgi:hypothetical protein
MFSKTIVCTVVGLLLVSGCGKPPVEQVAGAEDALKRAGEAEAQTYAPEAYQMAADTLQAAMAAKKEADSKFKLTRNYKDTERLLAKAEVLANEASTQAQTERENVRLETGRLLARAHTVIDSARTAIRMAPQGKGTRAEIELMKSDLAAAASAIGEAQGDYDTERYAAAKVKLVAAIEKARGISNEIAVAAAKRMKR